MGFDPTNIVGTMPVRMPFSTSQVDTGFSSPKREEWDWQSPHVFEKVVISYGHHFGKSVASHTSDQSISYSPNILTELTLTMANHYCL